MNAGFRIGIAAGILTAAGVAGWFSVSAPDAGKQGAVVSALPDRFPSSPPAAGMVMRSVSLTDLEQGLLEKLDPGIGSFSGERFEELCSLPNETPGLPRVDRAYGYAKAWAEQHPEQLFEWLHRRGGLTYVSGRAHTDATLMIFRSWAAKDPSAAIKGALSCTKPEERGNAMGLIITALRKSDPARAAAVAAEHIAVLDHLSVFTLGATEGDYRGTLDFLRALPAGKNRDAVLARFFEGVVRYHGSDCAQIWNEMPDDLRRSLVAGGFKGKELAGLMKDGVTPAKLAGLEELHREYAETSGDAQFIANWMRNGALDWAGRDPAAAVAWAQAHLKGQQRVDGTARLFSAGAAKNFDAALRAWQELPDGVLRARAAGNIAAGAPVERRPEVEALLQSLSPGDRKIAAAAHAGTKARMRDEKR